MQRGACQANRAQHLVTQLQQAGKDVFDTGTRLGDALAVSLLRLGQWLILAAFTLNRHASTLSFQVHFAFTVVPGSITASKCKVSCSLAVQILSCE